MTKPDIIIMVGLPGTGKSTLLEKYVGKNTTILSTDANVLTLGKAQGITDYNTAWKKFIQQAEKQFWSDLTSLTTAGHNLVIDRTNLTRASRKRIFDIVRKSPHNYSVQAWVFGMDISPYEWMCRLAKRPDKTIPIDALMRMGSTFEFPSVDEGYTTIKISNRGTISV